MQVEEVDVNRLVARINGAWWAVLRLTLYDQTVMIQAGGPVTFNFEEVEAFGLKKEVGGNE